MVQIIPSNERTARDFGWLKTRWHFSFGDYHDPRNMRWGALRVFNDDIVRGGGGFPPHPHEDMEIVSLVLEGALEHKDSTGAVGVVHPWEVQVMSAGTGIEHSEYNHSKTEDVHFLQLWIRPRNRGNRPRWEQKQFAPADARNRLLPLVSAGDVPDTLAIDQDAAIYLSRLDTGKSVTHTTRPDRKLYAFLISGRVTANDSPMEPGDQARIADESHLSILAKAESDLILLDLPG